MRFLFFVGRFFGCFLVYVDFFGYFSDEIYFFVNISTYV